MKDSIHQTQKPLANPEKNTFFSIVNLFIIFSSRVIFSSYSPKRRSINKFALGKVNKQYYTDIQKMHDRMVVQICGVQLTYLTCKRSRCKKATDHFHLFFPFYFKQIAFELLQSAILFKADFFSTSKNISVSSYRSALLLKKFTVSQYILIC